MTLKKNARVRAILSITLILLLGSNVFAGNLITFFQNVSKYLKKHGDNLEIQIGENNLKLILKDLGMPAPNTDKDLEEAKFIAMKKAENLLDRIGKFLKIYVNSKKFSLKLGASYAASESKNNEISTQSESKKSSDTYLSTLKMQIELTKGAFPKQLYFKTSTSTQYHNKKLIENESDIILAYRHYFGGNFTAICYAERFSNKHLSVKQRYEIGVALHPTVELINEKNNPHFLNLKKDIDSFLAYFDASNSEVQDLNQQSASINETLGEEGIKNFIKPIAIFYEKQNVFLKLGLGGIILLDVEQVEIETYMDDIIINPDQTYTIIESNKPQKFLLDAVYLIRPCLQGNIDIRLSRDLSLSFQMIYKFMFSNIRGFSDARTDIFFDINYRLAKPKWAKALFISAQYDFHYDHLSSNIPKNMLLRDEFIGKRPRFTTANNRDQNFQIKMVVEF